MNFKKTATKLMTIANEIDKINYFYEANVLTKIAQTLVDESTNDNFLYDTTHTANLDSPDEEKEFKNLLHSITYNHNERDKKEKEANVEQINQSELTVPGI